MRREITHAIREAVSWTDLVARLAALDLCLSPKLDWEGGGVYVTDDKDRQRPLADYWSAGTADLEERFGEPYAQYDRRMIQPLVRATGRSYEDLCRTGLPHLRRPSAFCSRQSRTAP
jgi:hypothetical protein